jgi:voltage-gated potassium channel
MILNKVILNDKVVLFFILISTILFVIESDISIANEFPLFFNISEYFIVIFFSIEYILRILSSKNKFKYIFSFFGLIDILSILPFYLGLYIDLRILRSFRLLRVFRLMKVVKYNNAINRLVKGLLNAKEELVIFLFTIFILLILVSTGIYYFEREVQPEKFGSIFESMWWAIITLTTVGYGDVYPISVGGKIFTGLVLIIGVGLITIPAGIIANSFNEIKKDVKKGD